MIIMLLGSSVFPVKVEFFLYWNQDQRSTVGEAYPTQSVIQLIEAGGEVDSRI